MITLGVLSALLGLGLLLWAWLDLRELRILRSRRAKAQPEISDPELESELEHINGIFAGFGLPNGLQVQEKIDEDAIRELPGDGETTVCRYCEVRVPLSFMRSIDVEDGIFDRGRPFWPFRDVLDAPCEFFCAHCLDAEDYPAEAEMNTP